MAGDWTAQLIEGSTIVGSDLSSVDELKAGWALRDSAPASLSLPPGSDLKAVIKPLITDLRVGYQGEWLGRWKCTGRDRSIDRASSTASYTFTDYRGLLARRRRHAGYAATMTPAEGAWDLIDRNQSRSGAGWDLGITRGSWFPFNPTRNLTSDNAEELLSVIDRWAEQHPGFDWWIDAQRRFQASPGRGRTSIEWPLKWGDTIHSLGEDFSAADYANHIHSTGAEGLTRYQTSTFDNPFDQPRPEGRWEDLVANTQRKTTDDLAAAGDQALARRSTLAPAYTTSVIRGTWDPGKAWIGDVVRIQSDHPDLTVNTADRISAIAISFDPDDTEPDVDITAGTTFREDLAVMLGRVPRRLLELDRR
jgi:hypothetical protein